MRTDEQKIALFLDWWNNFVSSSAFAEHHNLSMAEVENIIEEGRRLHNERAARLKVRTEKAKAIYLPLREQYLSDRPMTSGEERQMWDASAELAILGWNWAKITDEQLRENR